MKCPKHDAKMIIADLNTKVGREQIYHSTTGKYSLHSLNNDTGNRLIRHPWNDNTLLGHICRATWISPDGNIKN